MRSDLSRSRFAALLLGTVVTAFPAAAEQPSGPVTSGPVTSGPVTSGPVTSGPVTSGPIPPGAVAAAAIPPVPGMSAAAAATAPAPADVFAIQQLDALLAPVALYPDTLLAPLLMAATDPLAVVMAARWAARPEHGAPGGDALAAVLAAEDWDPDVKALAAAPAVLRLLDDNLGWTVQLGYAVANQTAAVLDSVQRLRRQAISVGTLAGTDQVTVRHTGVAVVIEAPYGTVPATGDPAATFGTWPYPGVAPVRLTAADLPAVSSAPAALRDLATFSWPTGEITVNVKAWNAANADRPPISSALWHPRQVAAMTGSVDAGLGARLLPPPGPVGRPAAPSGIPANAIGRQTVTVAAALVRRPVAPAARAALAAAHLPPPAVHAGPVGAAQPIALHLAPLPAHLETARASALSDVTSGADAALFGARGADSRQPVAPASAPSSQHQDMAGLVP
jgi:hypothetical protein